MFLRHHTKGALCNTKFTQGPTSNVRKCTSGIQTRTCQYEAPWTMHLRGNLYITFYPLHHLLVLTFEPVLNPASISTMLIRSLRSNLAAFFLFSSTVAGYEYFDVFFYPGENYTQVPQPAPFGIQANHHTHSPSTPSRTSWASPSASLTTKVNGTLSIITTTMS
jgi:hypothetical protein